MALGLAATKGLSFTNDWDKDITRLYQREEYAAQVRQEKERKTQFYGNLLKQGHASNPRAEQELQTLYDGLNGQLAQIVTENPDLETNPTAMAKFLSVSEQYINNDPLRKDKQVAQEFEKLRNATSQGILTQDEVESETKRYHDYISGKPGDGLDPYVFTKFKQLEIPDIVADISKMTGTIQETIPGTLDPRTGLFKSRISFNPTELTKVVDALYSDQKTKRAIDKFYGDLIEDNPLIKSLYPEPRAAQKAIEALVKSQEKIIPGEMDLGTKKSLSGSNTLQTSEQALTVHVAEVKNLTAQKDPTTGKYTDQGMLKAQDMDTYLTVYGSPKSDNTPTIYNRDGVLGVSEIQVGTGKDGKPQMANQYVNLGLSQLQVERTSVGNWISVGGVPYLEVFVKVYNARIETAAATKDLPAKEKWTYNKETLDALGFKQGDWVKPGIMSEAGIETTKMVGTIHSGRILMPMVVTKDGLSGWAQEHGGPDEQKVSSESYNNPILGKEIETTNQENALKTHLWYKNNIFLKKMKSDSEWDQDDKDKFGDYEKGRFYHGTKDGVEGLYDNKTKDWYPLIQ